MNTVDFKTLLQQKEFILLDGAMGTMIQQSGAGYRHCPETLNLTRPELITSFHRAYIEAGADIKRQGCVPRHRGADSAGHRSHRHAA